MSKLCSLILLMTFLISCSSPPTEYSSAAMVKISSDGRYVLSAHHGRKLILWDVKNKTSKVISTDVNIFSPSFIEKSHDFIWQDIKTDTITIQNVELNVIKKIKPNFPVCGIAATANFKEIVICDKDWNLYVINRSGEKKLLKPADGLPNYKSVGKLLNMHIKSNYLLTTGTGSGFSNISLRESIVYEEKQSKRKKHKYSMWGGVMVWDIKKVEPYRMYDATDYKTVGDLSPGGVCCGW